MEQKVGVALQRSSCKWTSSSSSHKARWASVTWNWPNNLNKKSINNSKQFNLREQGLLRPRGEEPHLDVQLESGGRGQRLSQTVFCSDSAPYSQLRL